MATLVVNKENFKEVVERKGLVLLDWWAPWCAPCRAFGPIFEQVSAAHPEMTFGKVNTDEEQELAQAFQVRSIPTLMVLRDQVALYAQAGSLPAAQLEELIREAAEVDMDKVRQELQERRAQPKA